MNGYGFNAEGIYHWGVFQAPTVPLYPILPQVTPPLCKFGMCITNLQF